jgi:ABC-type lipoprotein export system ATPase subunit
VILVTHNPNLAQMANRSVELRDGMIYTGAEACKPDEGCA